MRDGGGQRHRGNESVRMLMWLDLGGGHVEFIKPSPFILDMFEIYHNKNKYTLLIKQRCIKWAAVGESELCY